MVKLTDAKLRAANPGDIFRERGIEFRFKLGGRAGVRFTGRIKGTSQRVAYPLGEYPSLGLADARKLRDEAARQCAQGIDPRHARKARAEAQQLLVGPLVQEYIASLTNRPSTVGDKRRVLKAGLASWAKRPINTISKADISRLKDDHKDRPALCRSLYSYVSHFLGWCVERDHLSHNPCSDVKPPKPIRSRERVLTDDEIKALMIAKGNIWATMLQIVVLTGQRGGEVCKMRVTEISVAKAIWTIPAETMKQGRTHKVPLSAMALEIIRREMDERPQGWGPYLFGVGTEGKKPYNGRSNGMSAVLELTGTSGWAGHDCRRTAVTLMERLGIPEVVWKVVSGHSRGRDGASPYARHRFEEEARRAVEKLASEVARIVRGGAEIITLSATRPAS